MKKGNLRTIKIYEKGRPVRYGIEVRPYPIKGLWKQAFFKQGFNEKKRPLIFDLEYDCCARMLSFFEKDPINFKVGADAK